jgi:nucleolar protein 4
VDYKVEGKAPKSKKAAKEALEDKRKRLIVEFAIENANVVSRRSDREDKAREPKGKDDEADTESRPARDGKQGMKRKRDSSSAPQKSKAARGQKGKGAGADDGKVQAGADAKVDEKEKEKLAQRTRIIAQKRMKRKAKRAGK